MILSVHHSCPVVLLVSAVEYKVETVPPHCRLIDRSIAKNLICDFIVRTCIAEQSIHRTADILVTHLVCSGVGVICKDTVRHIAVTTIDIGQTIHIIIRIERNMIAFQHLAVIRCIRIRPHIVVLCCPVINLINVTELHHQTTRGNLIATRRNRGTGDVIVVRIRGVDFYIVGDRLICPHILIIIRWCRFTIMCRRSVRRAVTRDQSMNRHKFVRTIHLILTTEIPLMESLDAGICGIIDRTRRIVLLRQRTINGCRNLLAQDVPLCVRLVNRSGNCKVVPHIVQVIGEVVLQIFSVRVLISVVCIFLFVINAQICLEVNLFPVDIDFR